VEVWESEEAMGAHLTGDSAEEFVQALLSFSVEPPELYRYDTSGRQLIPLG
jgi:quinol monooxygenase YgiN